MATYEEYQKFLELLDSDTIKQGNNQLYKESDNSFCCLGVWTHFVKGYELDSYEMAGSELHYAGFEKDFYSAYGERAGRPFLLCLASYNDIGNSFKEIANILREYWHEYLKIENFPNNA